MRGFAVPLGVSYAAVNHWEKGDHPITEMIADIIEKHHCISSKWLRTGEGEMKMPGWAKYRVIRPPGDPNPHGSSRVAKRNAERVETIVPHNVPTSDNIVRIPVYEQDVSAGFGVIVEYEPVVAALVPYDADWLRERVGVSAKHLAMIRVVGDSMSPTICNNDYVMIDIEATKRHFRDGIWVFRLGDAIHVKRVQKISGSTFQALSVNADYRPFTFDNDFQFIGRVVWSDKLW